MKKIFLLAILSGLLIMQFEITLAASWESFKPNVLGDMDVTRKDDYITMTHRFDTEERHIEKGQRLIIAEDLQKALEKTGFEKVTAQINSSAFPKKPSDHAIRDIYDIALLRLGTQEYPEGVTATQAEREISKRGYFPATLWELLTYLSKSPENKRELYPVIALGSKLAITNGAKLYHEFPYFVGHPYSAERWLNTIADIKPFYNEMWFLIVKPSR